MRIPLTALLAIIAVHSLWGANPIAVKFGLVALPPLWSAFVRFCIGAVCVYLWARWRGVGLTPRRGEWPVLWLLTGLFCLQIATMNIGIDFTSGSLASILIATNPLFAAGFAHLLLPDDKLDRAKAAGLAIAMAGVTLTLLQGGSLGFGELLNPGNWILLFSAVMLGGRLVMNAKSLRRIPAERVVFWQMLLSLPLFALGGLWLETIRWQQLGWKPAAGLIYQGCVIAGLGFMAMSVMMQRYPPSLVLSFNFVSPVVGVLLSVWLLSEALSWQTVTGMVTVGVGLYLIARE